MRLTIHQFRRIEDGEYELAEGGVSLFCGPNESGKTTVCQALSSLLRGPEYVPVSIPKKDCAQLVHNGASEAELRLEWGKSFRSIQWPTSKCLTEGPSLEASEFALGLKSICDNTAETQSGLRERTSMLSSVLSVEPTREDLERTIQVEGLRLSSKGVEALWDRLQAGDAGWMQAKEEGQRLKGEWQAVTRQTWGSREGTNWVPQGWEPELQGASEETLTATCFAARQEVEALLQAGAVADVERARLDKLVEELPTLRNAFPALEGLVVKYTELVSEARQRAMAPRPEPSPKNAKLSAIGAIYTCAWTGKPERLAGGKLVKVEEPHQPELMAPPPDALAEWQRLQAALTTQEDRLANARLDLERTKNKIAEAEAAEKQLTELPEPVNNSAQLEAARTAEALTQSRLSAWQQKTRADHTHRQILVNQSIVRILSPEGVRAEVLTRALTKFNGELHALCSLAEWRGVKWQPVTLQLDFLPHYGDWAYRLLSESAQFRVRVVLQVAMALREKAPLIVIDRCDLLDRHGRNCLFNLLRKVKLPAVIAMTMNSEEEKPDLSKLGGRSYWLGGTVNGKGTQT